MKKKPLKKNTLCPLIGLQGFLPKGMCFILNKKAVLLKIVIAGI